jgi:hypothetical protein
MQHFSKLEDTQVVSADLRKFVVREDRSAHERYEHLRYVYRAVGSATFGYITYDVTSSDLALPLKGRCASV